VSAAPGGSVGSVATVASLNGFNGAVGLSCPNPPPGVSCSFTPNPVTPPANATASSGLTVAVGVGVMAGSYQLEVRGESGSLSRSATLSLAVQSAQDFAIACQPTSLTVTRNCGLARATCAVRSLNGFSSPVALSVEGGPTGVTTSLFTPVTPPPNGTADSAVAVSANADAPLGNHTIRVRGASGGLTRAADLTLTIQPSAGGLLLDESFSGGVAQDIVTNGDFETPDAGPGWVVYHAGQTFGGWTVESGTVEHKGVWQDARGRQSVDLTGVGAGAIYQDLATVPGQTYQLRFAMAGNPGGGPAVKRMEVWWGDTGVDTPSFDTTGRTSDDMGWRYQQYSVTATAAVTRLRFKSLIEGVWGPALDDVSVTRPASGGGAIPPAWTVIDGGSGGGAAATWTAVNPGNRNIGAPFTSPFAIVDSDSAGAAARQDEQLITPPFNASCCRQVILEFSNQFRRWSSEIADVDVSTDGGVNWINVLRMQGASDGYPTPNTKTIDITSAIAANPANARIRFHYYNGDWEWWWAIDNVRVRCESASPDFGLRLDPPAIDVLQTSSASSTVTITSTGGFNSPLRLSCEQPLPSGVRCGFNPATVTPSPNGAVTSLLTVSADAAATPGPHILNVLAQGDLIGRGVSFRVTVEPRPMFTINCQPDALVAPQGGMARSNCTLTSTGGFNSPVNLFCQNLPPGAQCGFSPNPVTPPANGSVGFTQTMSVGTNVAPGTYGYRVYGAPVNGLTQSFDRVLTVTPLEQVTFTVQGGCAPTDRVRVRLTPGGDFDTPVTLSYPRGQTVRLEAIASDIQCGILQAFFPFGHWEINGAPQPAQQRVINLTLTQNTTAFAKYLPRIIGPEPEQEPNELPSQANPISLPGGRTGVAAAGDATAVQIVYTNGDRDGIEDLFAVMLAESARLELTVSFTNAAADLDLFLLRIVGSSVSVLGVSNSGAATIERIVTNSALAPGVYYIGVSAWRGSSAYTLTAMKPELQLRSIHQPIGQTQSGEAAIDSRLTVWGQPANTVRVKTQ
jgi:choice-of-anchor C domain-containing protein